MTHGIVKIHKMGDVPFTQIPNDLIRDPAITSNAVRLYAYLASHSDGYDLAYQQIERQTDLGEHAIRQAIKLLVSTGWLETARQRTAGKLGKYDFYVYASRLDHSKVESFQGGTITPHIEEHLNKKNTKEEFLSKKAKRPDGAAIALPEGWLPKQETKDNFGSKWLKIDYAETLEEFTNHHKGKGTKWKDWDLAFINWCNRAEKWAKPGPVHTMSREESEIQDLLKRAKR